MNNNKNKKRKNNYLIFSFFFILCTLYCFQIKERTVSILLLFTHTYGSPTRLLFVFKFSLVLVLFLIHFLQLALSLLKCLALNKINRWWERTATVVRLIWSAVFIEYMCVYDNILFQKSVFCPCVLLLFSYLYMLLSYCTSSFTISLFGRWIS